MSTLKENFDYYLSHQSELLKRYAGRYLVLKDCEVVGDYDDEREAYFDAVEHYGLGHFLIQYCSEGRGAYTQTFINHLILENV